MQRLILLIASTTFLVAPWSASGQSATMPGVENSVGYLASGTSIQPKTTSESTPMIHGSFGNWMAMLHANAFLVDVQQKGPRGRDKLFSTNWIMPMLHLQSGRQGVTLRTMLSFEPATITSRRYPLLFQTGETAYGLSIIDGQHPHDFFMELAGRYDVAVGEHSQVFVYGGPVGEAALGPTAFPHRASASENPLAPIGHHAQDSTHIASNVINVGLVKGPIQIEASTFHGQEPNESRWNIGRGKPDSFSTRVTVAPYRDLTAQFSTGRINEPESTDPRLDTIRTTASLHYGHQLSSGHIAMSVIWGRNKNIKDRSRRVFNAYGFEMTAKFRRRNWVWTRIENLDRDQSLLPPVAKAALPSCLLCEVVGRLTAVNENVATSETSNHIVLGADGLPTTIEEIPIGRVQAYTIGYERELPIAPRSLNVGLGLQATVYGLPANLKAVYGDRPATLTMFLRVRPRGNIQEHMKLMHQR